jgi:hypothetical protein
VDSFGRFFQRLRGAWHAWSVDERYAQISRFNLAFVTLLMLLATMLTIAFQEWRLAAIAGVTMVVGIIGILRTPWPRDEPDLRSLIRRWFG